MSSLARQSLRNEPPKEACLVAALLRCITKKLVSTNLCLPSSHKGWSCQHWTFCSALGTAKGYRRLHLLCCPLNFQKHLNFNHQMEDVNRAQKKIAFWITRQNSLFCCCSQILHLSLPVIRTTRALLYVPKFLYLSSSNWVKEVLRQTTKGGVIC